MEFDPRRCGFHAAQNPSATKSTNTAITIARRLPQVITHPLYFASATDSLSRVRATAQK
jgi:hypothetical protein